LYLFPLLSEGRLNVVKCEIIKKNIYINKEKRSYL
jgi:hypothetical protein